MLRFKLDVPAPFQFLCYQTVARVDLTILREGTLGFVACLLQLAFQRLALVVALGREPVDGSETRRNALRRDRFQDQRTHRLIDRGAAEAQTIAAADRKVTAAHIARRRAALALVTNVQLAATPPAAQQAGQQPLAAAHRLGRFVRREVAAVVAHDGLVSFVRSV